MVPNPPAPGADPRRETLSESGWTAYSGAGRFPIDERGRSMMEIERRFLCRQVSPGAFEHAERRSIIRQGYLTVSDPAVRIRQQDDAFLLAVKSGEGLVRREVEFPVEPAVAHELMAIAGDRQVEKVRWRLGRWEIDVFRGKLEGLLIAEVELQSEDEPLPEPPPGITLVREITGERRFTNQCLAQLSTAEAARLVREVTGESA